MPCAPYSLDALEPFISRSTLALHQYKHHRAYVDKANGLARRYGLESQSPLEIVRRAAKRMDWVELYNNAAQAWNHEFYWNSLAPDGGEPHGELRSAIYASFGGIDRLRTRLVEAGADHFGSGWVWLVRGQSSGLNIITTRDAGNLEGGRYRCLLCIDVWEHAYYLDYKNDRKAHLEAIVTQLLNWKWAAERYAVEDGRGREIA